MQKKVSVLFMLLGILFNICLVASNLLETKVISLFGITATAGLIVFPISYIINDCIAEIWGFRKARLIIWCGFLSNFLIIAFGKIAIQLPAAPFWQHEESFNFVFGLAPRVAVASLIAFLFGSFLNAYVMSKMKLGQQGRNFSLRAVASTLFGETVDSLVFFPIAFYGVLPNTTLVALICTQAGMKTAYEIVVLPLTVRVVRYLKRKEELDVYDYKVSYKWWRIFDF